MSIVDINGNELKGTLKDHVKVNRDNIRALVEVGQAVETQFALLVKIVEQLAKKLDTDFATLLDEARKEAQEALQNKPVDEEVMAPNGD